MLCPECGKSFPKKDNLKRHIAQTHKGEKLNLCTICGKSFGEKGHLKKHISEVHESIRPYKCPFCERRCARKLQVVVHAKSKHQTTLSDEEIIEVKGQEISEGNCGVFNFPKNQHFFPLICTLASKKGSNKKTTSH